MEQYATKVANRKASGSWLARSAKCLRGWPFWTVCVPLHRPASRSRGRFNPPGTGPAVRAGTRKRSRKSFGDTNRERRAISCTDNARFRVPLAPAKGWAHPSWLPRQGRSILESYRLVNQILNEAG